VKEKHCLLGDKNTADKLKGTNKLAAFVAKLFGPKTSTFAKFAGCNDGCHLIE
jgi:hypothetical protein